MPEERKSLISFIVAAVFLAILSFSDWAEARDVSETSTETSEPDNSRSQSVATSDDSESDSGDRNGANDTQFRIDCSDPFWWGLVPCRTTTGE